MQDKDFDKLFSSKFEDFEAEPSPMVWKNIAGGLEDKKAILPWATYLSVAAGIMLVFTVGWLFLQKDLHTGEKHHNYASLVHRDMVKPVISATMAPTPKQAEPALVDSVSGNRPSVSRMASNSNHPHKSVLPVNKVTVLASNKTDDMVKASQPAVNANPPLVAKTVTPANIQAEPIMPDVQLSPKTIDAGAATLAEKPAVIISTEKETEGPVKKRGIHNLGGLINALVSKIDRRQDKFIEFSDGVDDDAETTVTGVNMGPIKFKKQ